MRLDNRDRALLRRVAATEDRGARLALASTHLIDRLLVRGLITVHTGPFGTFYLATQKGRQIAAEAKFTLEPGRPE